MVDQKQRSELIQAIQKAVSDKIEAEGMYHATVAAALYSTLSSWVALERDDTQRRELVQVIQYGLPIDVEASNSLLPAIEEDKIGDTRGTA